MNYEQRLLAAIKRREAQGLLNHTAWLAAIGRERPGVAEEPKAYKREYLGQFMPYEPDPTSE